MNDENKSCYDIENSCGTDNEEQIEINGSVIPDIRGNAAEPCSDPAANNEQTSESTYASADDENGFTTNKDIRKPPRHISVHKIIQLSAALLLTLALLVAYPIYSWFRLQRQIARYEKISVPNSLYITAARREDSRFFEMNNIDITANWISSDGTTVERATYQDYVFTVAGDFVENYTLQLAHTTNNNYKYEIFEAGVTLTNPSTVDENKIPGKDYVEYTLSKTYDPSVLAEIDDDYSDVQPGTILYYYIKKDDNNAPISLNGRITNGTFGNSTYTVDSKTVTYNGHYLNQESDFAALGTGQYHNETYGSSATVGTGPNTDVQTHAEPLYWQATGIPVEGSATRPPFFHEYILRISWTNNHPTSDPSTEFKDTDIIYISVEAD